MSGPRPEFYVCTLLNVFRQAGPFGGDSTSLGWDMNALWPRLASLIMQW